MAPESAHASSSSWMKLKTELDDDCTWSWAIVDAMAIDVACDVAVDVECGGVDVVAVLRAEHFGE